MMKARAALFIVALPLTACSVGPQYQRPELDVPSAFRAQAETPTERSLGDLVWWDVYQDKTLQQLLATALAQNRDVKLAAARVAEARAVVGATRLGQFPQVNATLNGERGRVFQGGEHVTGALFSGEAQVSFELDLWGRLASMSDAARANLLSTEYAHGAVHLSLLSDVATAYFNLLALDQQVRVTQRVIATRDRFLDLTRTKFRQGAASGLDVSRAEANLSVARANLPELQRQIAQTENQLHILMGETPAPIARESLDLQALPTPPEVPAGLPSSLLERRPDLRQAEANLIGATANVRVAKAALFPTISLTGSFGSESLEITKLFTGPTKVWSLGFGLLQPLLNAQRNRYQVEAARAREEQALLQYQSAVASAFREVSDALEARHDYSNLLRAQEQQVTSLREAS